MTCGGLRVQARDLRSAGRDTSYSSEQHVTCLRLPWQRASHTLLSMLHACIKASPKNRTHNRNPSSSSSRVPHHIVHPAVLEHVPAGHQLKRLAIAGSRRSQLARLRGGCSAGALGWSEPHGWSHAGGHAGMPRQMGTRRPQRALQICPLNCCTSLHAQPRPAPRSPTCAAAIAWMKSTGLCAKASSSVRRRRCSARRARMEASAASYWSASFPAPALSAYGGSSVLRGAGRQEGVRH